MPPRPELSIIIVSYNVRELLARCLQSVYATSGNMALEVIIVDNASSDGSAEMVRKQFQDARLLSNDTNLGFAAANNQAYAVSTGAYILLLNPDTAVTPGAVATVLDFMKRTPDAGMAGCRLVNADGSLQSAIINCPSVAENLLTAFYIDGLFYRNRWKRTYYRPQPFVIDIPAGAFMMVRRSALKGMPLLDPAYFMYSEEADLAWRLREGGYQCYYVPGGETLHVGEQSTSPHQSEMFCVLQESKLRFYYRHYKACQALFLALTLWLVLFSRLLTAVLLLPFKGIARLRLFLVTVGKYPSIWRKVAAER